MTDPIDRRELFRRATFGAGVLAWPRFLEVGFQDGEKQQDRVAVLKVAAARAREQGKVLTVFVVPADAKVVQPRGALFGLLLNHCGPRTLFELATFEPCCATVAELKGVFEGIELEAEPWMLCLAYVGESKQLATHVVEPDFSNLVPVPSVPFSKDVEAYMKALEENRKARQKLQQATVAIMETALVTAVAALRADLVRTPPDSQVKELIERISSTDERAKPDLTFDHGAAIHAAMDAEKDDKRRARLVAALVAAGTKHYRTDRVPGSKWASDIGCGLTIEGEEGGAMFPCGTAMTPPGSSRFLHFYTR